MAAIIYTNTCSCMISALSFSVNASADKPPPNLLIPLLFDNGPPTVTSVNTFAPSVESTLIEHGRHPQKNIAWQQHLVEVFYSLKPTAFLITFTFW